MSYQVPEHIANSKVFLTNFSEVQGGRLDPVFVYSMKYKKKFNYPSKSLNKLVSFTTGGTPSKAKPEYWGGDIYWVSAKDFKSFYLDRAEDTITELGLKNSSSKLIPQNSLLMVVRSGILLHTLPIAINKCPVAINQDIKALFIKDSQVDSRYLGYFFDVFNKYVLSKVVKHSTTVQSVNTDELEKIEIPIPTKEIQLDIVNIMDSAYVQKHLKEQQAKALLQSIDDYLLGELGIQLPETKSQTIQDRMFVVNHSELSGDRLDPMFYTSQFSNIVAKLHDSATCKRLGQIAHFSSEIWNQRDYYEKEFPYIEIGAINITDSTIEDVSFVPVEQAPSRAKVIVRTGDIIISTTRPDRGAIIKITENENLYIASTGFSVIRNIDSNINPDYLLAILRHKLILMQMRQRSTGGNYPAITQEELSKIIIPILPIPKQQEIVNHISAIRQQAKALQEEGKAILEQAKKEVEQMILG